MKVYIQRWIDEAKKPRMRVSMQPFYSTGSSNEQYWDKRNSVTREEVELNLPDGVPIAQFSDLYIRVIVDGSVYESDEWCLHPEWFTQVGTIVGHVAHHGHGVYHAIEWWVWDYDVWVYHTAPNFSDKRMNEPT